MREWIRNKRWFPQVFPLNREFPARISLKTEAFKFLLWVRTENFGKLYWRGERELNFEGEVCLCVCVWGGGGVIELTFLKPNLI